MGLIVDTFDGLAQEIDLAELPDDVVARLAMDGDGPAMGESVRRLLGDDLTDTDLSKAAAEFVDSLALLGKAAGYAGRGTPAGKWRARHLHRYWTKGKGVALWATSPKPWTTLHRHLKRYIKDPEKAKRTAAKWFHETLGYWPGSDLNRVLHGSPPRGKRIGPG